MGFTKAQMLWQRPRLGRLKDRRSGMLTSMLKAGPGEGSVMEEAVIALSGPVPINRAFGQGTVGDMCMCLLGAYARAGGLCQSKVRRPRNRAIQGQVGTYR